MSAPSPSWYDLLGVEATASPDEIRAAWKAGIAELEPTDRRFRLLNQAAEVLLDPEERAAYDSEALRAQRASEAAVVEEVAQQPSGDLAPDAGTAAQPEAKTSRVVPAWVLAGLGVLAAVLIGLCIWQSGEPTDEKIAEATSDAQVAAGPAAEALLSYDYRDLEATKAAAEGVITDDYRDEDYQPFFEGVVQGNAVDTKTIVSGQTVETAVVRSGADRVQILVLIDRQISNAVTTTPEVSRDQATLTMVKVGEDWLVDKVDIKN